MEDIRLKNLMQPELPTESPKAGINFTGQTPESLTSGELNGNIKLVDGHLQSSNFVIGVSGWKIDADGNVEFSNGVFRGTLTAVSGTLGALTIASGGNIKFGKTAYSDDANAGFWLGDDGGTAKFNIGSSSTKYLHYDGTNFTILGGTISGGIIQTNPGTTGSNTRLDSSGNVIDFLYNNSSQGYIASGSTGNLGINAGEDLILTYNDGGGTGGVVIYNDATIVAYFDDNNDFVMNGHSIGLGIRSSTPGSASSYKGYMYFDTTAQDICFSNGTDWYKVTATLR